jgi:hypothetical protein
MNDDNKNSSEQIEVVPLPTNLHCIENIEIQGTGSPSDQIEQKIWNIIQSVPGLNVGYVIIIISVLQILTKFGQLYKGMEASDLLYTFLKGIRMK